MLVYIQYMHTGSSNIVLTTQKIRSILYKHINIWKLHPAEA
jgi:hypothetical protein